MQNILECCICYNQYNFKDQVPKIIPSCHHTICLKCLDGIINVQGHRKCPLDRIPFPSECQNPEAFQLNLEIIDKLEEAQAGICEVHQKNNTMVCFTDKIKICEDCIVEDGPHYNHKKILIKEMRKTATEKIERLKTQLVRFEQYQSQQALELENKKQEVLQEAKKVVENLQETVKRKDNELYFELDAYFAARKLIAQGKALRSSEQQGAMEIEEEANNNHESKINEVLQGFYKTFVPMVNNYNLNHPSKLESRVQVYEKKFCCELFIVKSNERSCLRFNFGVAYPKVHDIISLDQLKEIKEISLYCASSNENLDSRYSMKELGSLWNYLNLEEENISEQIDTLRLDFQSLKNSLEPVQWTNILDHGLVRLSNLKTIDIKCSSKLTDASLRVFCENILPCLTSIEDFSMNMKETQITDNGMKLFFGNMKESLKNVRVFSLILWDTVITDEGTLVFVNEALPFMTSLKSFTFGLEDVGAGGVKLTDASIEPLFLGLKSVAGELEVVNIGVSGSEITERSFDAFVKEAFPLMVNLKDLKLSFRKTLIGKEVVDNWSSGLTITNKIYSS